jgi:endonuclease/exonuclease/phosphatase family metal-dependent hydrolase
MTTRPGFSCSGLGRAAVALPILFFALALAAAEIRVLGYNVKNYFVVEGRRGVKDEASVAALVAMLQAADADVLMFCELGSREALADLAARLRKAGLNYPHSRFMTGGDASIGLGMLSRIPPAEVFLKTGLVYSIRPKREYQAAETVPVQRGFLHAVFTVDGYRLHVVMAHLKSRLFHPRYNQTDMRRYEARLLRYYADEILKAEPEANLLVLGDLNDSADTDPLRILRGGNRPPELRLHDLRPADGMGLFWSHWWKQEDLYGRIDYLLASQGILPEISPEGTRIVHLPERWMAASDHRPLMATITTPDQPLLAPETVAARFPDGIRAPVPGRAPAPESGVVVPPPPEAAASAGPRLTFCFMDLGTPVADSADADRDLLRRLRATGAEVLVLAGVRDEATLRAIQVDLGANFAEWVEGDDPERHLALVSRAKPAAFTAHADLTYRIKDQDVPVRRGFLHARFDHGPYRLHVFGADLKNREKHPEFNQTDMRRYEGRQLRALVNQVLKAEPAANILVLGNFNDTCGMSTVKEIYNRRFGINKRLFDLRPVDPFHTSWTSWDPVGDAYERIDYALVTAALIPEIIREQTRIDHDPAWQNGAAHRPLVVAVSCRDAAEWPKERLDAIFPNTIYAAEAVFAGEKDIGVKRQRTTPTTGK